MVQFFENTNMNVRDSQNSEWVSNLAFLLNLTSYISKLNLQYQGKNKLIHEM